MSRLDDLELLEKAATPGPWQQSRFVDSPHFARMGRLWKEAREHEEAVTIRGAGTVGTPACNQVGQVFDPDDRAFLIAARNALPSLIAVARAARACVDSPLHAPELEPTVVFDALRSAVDALDSLSSVPAAVPVPGMTARSADSPSGLGDRE